MKLVASILLLALPFEADFREICGNRYLDRATTAMCESGMNPKARSFDGGEGLGQPTGKTWPWYLSKGWVPKGSTPFEVRPAIMGINRHEGYLEARFRAKGVVDPYLNWIAAGMAYNGGEKQAWTAIQDAEIAGLPGPEGWLAALHGKGAKYTPNYIRHKIRVRAQYRKQFGG